MRIPDPHQARIVFAAFLIGFITMAHEIIIGRVFGTYFGTSTLTWSGVIAAFILFIGLGYYLGGRLNARRRLHANLLGASLVLLVVMPFALETFFKRAPLDWIVQFVLGLSIASLPLLMLAAYIPSLIEQRIGGKARASSTVLSSDTVGSVIGVLTAGVVLLPGLGVWKSAAALSIFAAALMIQSRAKWWSVPIIACGIILFLNAPTVIPSPFSDIEVRYGNGIVELSFGPRSPQSAMYLARPQIPVYEYSVWVDEFNRRSDAETILMLGAGGCTHIPLLRESHPDARITVVDNNPTVFDVCTSAFGIREQENTVFVVDDARRFLAEEGSYDLIFVDTFGSLCTVPEHLITHEFHTELIEHLQPDGRVIMNTIFGSEMSKKIIEENLAASFTILDEHASNRTPGNRVFLMSAGGTQRPLITDDQNPYTLLLSRECLG
jgi:predicted membrane-bound spermidine synthase